MDTIHACDACGAVRVPGNAACNVCAAEYTPWAYLTHEQAFQMLLTLESAAAYGVTYIATNYDNDRATIAVHDDESGHIGDL